MKEPTGTDGLSGVVTDEDAGLVHRAFVVAYDEHEFELFQKTDFEKLATEDFRRWPPVFGDVGGERTWTDVRGEFSLRQTQRPVFVQIFKEGLRPATTIIRTGETRIHVTLVNACSLCLR